MLRIALLSVALVSGGVAAWLVAGMQPAETRTSDATATLVQVHMDEVLVAAVDVEQSLPLQPEHLRWQPWPAEAVNRAFISRSKRPDAIAELAGSALRNQLIAGEPIVAEKLAPPKTNLLSAGLAPGMRAVAIPISAESTAGGFVLPNDRVDVLLAVPCKAEDVCSAAMTARTILKNVRVLAIDQLDNAEGAVVGKTSTLELNSRQAETLIAAQASGVISLVLRSVLDNADQPDAVSESERTVRVWRSGVTEYFTVKPR